MMKKFSLFFICLFFVVSCSDYNTENVPTTQSSSSQSSQSSSAPAYPLVDEDGRNLVWHDEFEGTNLDTAKWIVETGVHVNNELQDYKASGNHQVTNGHLIITARYETSGGYNYTSARVKTDGKFNFTYG
ncbi:MAG: hypothetical protein KAR07_06210, partial [Spirochaetes bacterium]|nr:hypothetical protein [Spirochaetota bacterium]